MDTPLQKIGSSANQAAHQWPLFFGSFFADVVTLRNELLRFGKFGVAIVMNRGQRFSLFHAVPAEHGESDSKLLAISADNVAAGGTCYMQMEPRGRQAFRLVKDAF